MKGSGHGHRIARPDGSVALAGLEHGDRVSCSPLEGKNLGAFDAPGAVEELMRNDRQGSRALLVQREEALDQPAESLDRLDRIVVGNAALLQVRSYRIEHRSVESGFRWEMVKQPGVAEACTGGDAGDARTGKAVLSEVPLSLGEDSLSSVDAHTSMTLLGFGRRSGAAWL